MKKLIIIVAIFAMPFLTAIIISLIFALTILSPLIIITFIWFKIYDKKYKMYKSFFVKMASLGTNKGA